MKSDEELAVKAAMRFLDSRADLAEGVPLHELVTAAIEEKGLSQALIQKAVLRMEAEGVLRDEYVRKTVTSPNGDIDILDARIITHAS